LTSQAKQVLNPWHSEKFKFIWLFSHFFVPLQTK
jgi:hypothetical protein